MRPTPVIAHSGGAGIVYAFDVKSVHSKDQIVIESPSAAVEGSDYGLGMVLTRMEQDWADKRAGRCLPDVTITLQAPLKQGGASAASPFLGKCSDGSNWFIKPPVVGMTRALVAEWIVGRLGRAIGAPVCEVSLVEIPEELLPWEYSPGKQLVAGVGCGSRDLAGTPTEIRTDLQHRDDDDNRRRHAGVFAIVDWFQGSDLQWLLDVANDWTLHSHDHGWYLPPGGPNWTPEELRANVGTPWQNAGDAAGLDEAELERLATAVVDVPDEYIADVIGAVPPGWNVPSTDLDCLAWYLAERRAGVATRLRGLAQKEATA